MDDIRKLARTVYAARDGSVDAWEPPDHRHPIINRLVEAGFLRRVKMRCMHEALGEVGVTFTDVAHAAFGSMTEAS